MIATYMKDSSVDVDVQERRSNRVVDRVGVVVRTEDL